MEEVKELVPETKPVPLRIPAPCFINNIAVVISYNFFFLLKTALSVRLHLINRVTVFIFNIDINPVKKQVFEQAVDDQGNKIFDKDGNPVMVPAYKVDCTRRNLAAVTALKEVMAFRCTVLVFDGFHIGFLLRCRNSQRDRLCFRHQLFYLFHHRNLMTGLKEGDTVTIDGKTYTYTKGATGESGNEFSDFETLKKAASKNGVDLTRTPDDPTKPLEGVLSATTATQTFRPYDVQVNGETVSSFANIRPESMKYGDTITIDCSTFVLLPLGSFSFSAVVMP